MGFFTSFKPLSSWSVPELLKKKLELHEQWRASVLRGNVEKYEIEINDIENEFKRRGLNVLDEMNKQLNSFNL